MAERYYIKTIATSEKNVNYLSFIPVRHTHISTVRDYRRILQLTVCEIQKYIMVY